MGVAASMSSSQFVSPHEELICSMTVGVSLENGVLVHAHKEVPAEQVSFGLVPEQSAVHNINLNVSVLCL